MLLQKNFVNNDDLFSEHEDFKCSNGLWVHTSVANHKKYFGKVIRDWGIAGCLWSKFTPRSCEVITLFVISNGERSIKRNVAESCNRVPRVVDRPANDNKVGLRPFQWTCKWTLSSKGNCEFNVAPSFLLRREGEARWTEGVWTCEIQDGMSLNEKVLRKTFWSRF